MQLAAASSATPGPSKATGPSISIPNSVYELARDELRNAGGDTVAARAAMKARLLSEEGTFHAMLDTIVSAAATMATQAIVTINRQAIIASNTGMKASAAHALASVVGRAWLDFPLAGGLLLRDATKADVTKQAELYAAQSKVAGERARWLTAIAAAIPGGVKVGEVLTDEKVAELFQKSTA